MPHFKTPYLPHIKNESDAQLEAIKRFISGESYNVSTFIDEVTLTYGYGELSSLGCWQYELPQWFVNSEIFRAKK